jgi:predicted transcriptional regulator
MNDDKKESCALTSVIETEIDILNRHVHVLNTLQKNQPMGIIKLAEMTNYPQHMVRYSLRILEQNSAIEPSSKGAITTDEVPKILDLLKIKLNDISKNVNEIINAIE